jgi:hypothetical protein
MLIRFAISEKGTAIGLFGPAPVCLALEQNGCITFVDGVGTSPVRGLKSTARAKMKEMAHTLSLLCKMAMALFDLHFDDVATAGLSWSPFADNVCRSWVRAATLSADPLIPSKMIEDKLSPPKALRQAMANTAIALMRMDDLETVIAPALPGRITEMSHDAESWRVYMTSQFIVSLLHASDGASTAATGYAWNVLSVAPPSDDDLVAPVTAASMAGLTVSADGFVEYSFVSIKHSSEHAVRGANMVLSMLELTTWHPGRVCLSDDSSASMPHLFPVAHVPSHVLYGALKSASTAVQHFIGMQRSLAVMRSACASDDAPCVTPPKLWEMDSCARYHSAESSLLSQTHAPSPTAPLSLADAQYTHRTLEAAIKRNASLLARIDGTMRAW